MIFAESETRNMPSTVKRLPLIVALAGDVVVLVEFVITLIIPNLGSVSIVTFLYI
jgi:hypothetical protein